MVLVELAGGLGNQMFQYAFGRSIAIRNNTDLYFDLRFLENKNQQSDFTYRDYALNIFKLRAEVLTEENYLKADRLKKSVRSKFFRKTIPMWSNYIKEDSKRYHPNYKKASNNTYLKGYWQNPRYFRHLVKDLRKEFEFPTIKSPVTKDLEYLIKSNSKSVSVHVRRGDYTNILANLLACDTNYYTRAIDYIDQQVSEAKYFFFSDDIDWVKENLSIPDGSLFVDQSYTKKDFEDMYLMTQCHHHIIANSSFSWWGAWLSEYSNKTVVAPKNWDGRRKSVDIIESNWKLL